MDADYDPDWVEPYDANVEPKPDSVVFQPIFEHLRTESRRAIYLLRDVLASSKYQNAMTTSLLEEVIKRRVKDDTSEQTMFALSGDMAAGKSSVINSLLNTGTIARKGASGQSCTWVVQRFMKKFAGQEKPYAAKVRFFDEHHIQKLIGSMLDKYNRASAKDDQEDDPDSEDMKSDNYNDIRTVLDGFAALFCDREEFQDDEAARAFLSRAGTDKNGDVLRDLESWACEVVSHFLDGEQTISLDASSADELLFKLQPYTYQLGGDEGSQISPWPLVSVVDFGLDVPLLNQGIVLVDAPGLSDSNSTRAGNSLAYQRQCTHKITVADISRAMNDKSLRESLAQSYHYRGSSGTLLVLTRGDSIDTETEVTGTVGERKREQTLKNEIKDLRDERNKLNQKKRKLRREDQVEIDEEI